MDNIPVKFVSTPSLSLKCPLCFELFREPVISTRCGHTFCQRCVGQTLADLSQVACPSDQNVMGHTDFVPNRAVQGQIEDLLIYCRHGLYRVDSDDDFQTDEEGCREQIPLGRRQEHEDTCGCAWVPCPNSSNHCGKFRRQDLQAHLRMCMHVPCRNKEKGCEFNGTHEQVELHMADCPLLSSSVEWDIISSLDSENAVDGFHSRYLVKAVKNLNERVSSLEKGKEEMLSQIGKCNSNIINLTIQVDKLVQAVEQLRRTQVAIVADRLGSHSATDIAAADIVGVEYRRSVSSAGLTSCGSVRSRSSSGSNAVSNLSFAEQPKFEQWKMPLQFKCVGTFCGHSAAIRALLSRGPYVYSAGSDCTIKVWDIKDKDMKNSRGCIKTLAAHSREVHAMCVSAGLLYSAGADKAIIAWNLDKLQVQCTKQDAHADVIGALASTGQYIFSGSYSCIKVWRAGTLELLHTIGEILHWVRAFAVDMRKLKVYSASHNCVHIWDAESPFTSKGNLSHSHGSVYSLAVTRQYLILGTYNQNTHLYNVNTFQHVHMLAGHIGIINDLLASPSGNFLFTASYDSTAQLWDLKKLLPVQVLSRHEGSVNCLALRGDMLFSGSDDKEIKVYLFYQGLASKNLMVV